MIGLIEQEKDFKKKEYLKRLRYTYQKCILDMNLSKIKETELFEDYHYHIWYEKDLDNELKNSSCK